MNANISPDDPRLTAYALNEMEPAERAEFARALAQDAAARRAVEEIAATASLLTGALEHEAMQPVAKPMPRHDTYAKVIRFPYWKISGLAAACFAVFFIYWQRNEMAREQKQYIEVALTPVPEKSVDTPAPAAVTESAADTAAGERANRDELQSQTMDQMAKQAQENAAKEQLLAVRNEAIESVAKKAGAASVPATAKARAAVTTSVVPGIREEEATVLSPLQATAQDKAGDGASSTRAGSRRRADQKDMGAAATIAAGKISAGGTAESNAAGSRPDQGTLRASDHPLSASGAKTAATSYAEVQRCLDQGLRPPAEAVRIEELVNHFSYDYARPAGHELFSANLEVEGAPWAPAHRLVRIGLTARAPGEATGTGTRVEPAGGALVTIAKAVKLEVQFNPSEVQAYRLIGYENRRPGTGDSSPTRMDLGDDGADQALTVLYEVVPVGVAMSGQDQALKYERLGSPRPGSQNTTPREMLTVEIRYQEPAGGANRKRAFPLRDPGTSFEKASDDFKFATSVVAFGMMLQDSPFKGGATWGAVAAWAHAGLGRDAGGQRGDFLGLVARARQVVQ